MAETTDRSYGIRRDSEETQIDAKQAERLANELSVLSKEHSEAIGRATYVKMSSEEAAAFDKRRDRISEICSQLGKFKRL